MSGDNFTPVKTDFWHTMKEYFWESKSLDNGIETLKCWKFWIVLALYLASFLLIVRDPFFLRYYKVTLNGVLPFLISFILASAINWEMLLTGRPKGANLLLQGLMILPLSFLFSRMMGEVGSNHIEFNNIVALILKFGLDKLKDVAQDILKATTELLPVWISEMLIHPWRTLALVFILFSLCLRRIEWKISMLMLMVIILVVTTLGDKGHHFNFILSGICFFAGFCLQWNPYAKTNYFLNVEVRLDKENTDARLLKTILLIMTKLSEKTYMDSRQVEAIVLDIYSPDGELNSAEITRICQEITRRMVSKYDLLRATIDADGTRFFANQKLFVCNSILANITVFPRMLAAGMMSLLWVLSPIDAIPDYIPIFGILDDCTVFILSGLVLNSGLRKKKESGLEQMF